MAVIWGLDLHDMKWSNFKSSYMFGNTEFHLRRTKFIVYQCAMIFLVVSESLGTAVLSDYLDQRQDLQKKFPGINVWNNDYIGIASYNIFVGVYSAIIFGAAFFFDLFFPDRYEPTWVQYSWIGNAIFCAVAGLGDALAYTVILALHGEHISGVDLTTPELRQQLSRDHDKTPVLYKDSARAIASVVFLWVGWVFTVISTIVMIKFYMYYRKFGTARSTHSRKDMDEKIRASSTEQTISPESTTSRPDAIPRVSDGGRMNHYTVSNSRSN